MRIIREKPQTINPYPPDGFAQDKIFVPAGTLCRIYCPNLVPILSHPHTNQPGDMMKLETLAVHAGYSPDPTTKSVAVPIYQTVSYAFDDTQHGADLFDLKVTGNIYSRIMNPTCGVLEARVAAMEGGIGALAVASGMAAIAYAIQTIAEAGDNIVSAAA